MELARSILFLLLVMACSMAAEAKFSMRRAPKEGDLKALQVKQVSADKAHVYPDVKDADKKFFDKDYPFDKRPHARALHFKHPYPVVQDSNDFDKDFVKDENSDNGSWKAQETYDRLRTKLAKEKRDLAKALKKKLEEENEMKEAMAHHAQEEKDRDEAARKADQIRREEEERQRHENAHHEEEPEEGSVKHTAKKVAEIFKPAPKEELKDVDVSTKETEQAMDQLEECKKELAKARQALKDLMKELEDAKKKQNAANDALDEAVSKENYAKEHHSTLKAKVKSEYDEYQDARQAYLKQKAIVDKLETDIKVAASKVKEIRDSTDKDGGVYPTPGEGHKSSAFAANWMWGLVLALAAACSTQA